METTQTVPESNLTPAGPEAEPAPLWTGPKKRRKWIKRVLVIAAVLALLFWIVVRPMLGGTAAASGAYQTAQVQRQDLTVSVSGSGTVTPIESYQVSALVTGEILESPFEDGDQVEQDQLLIYLPSQKNKQDSQIDRVPNPRQMERTHPEAILQ